MSLAALAWCTKQSLTIRTVTDRLNSRTLTKIWVAWRAIIIVSTPQVSDDISTIQSILVVSILKFLLM